MKVLFANVSKKDARLLVSWWNANTPHLHFRRSIGRGRWEVYRQ